MKKVKIYWKGKSRGFEGNGTEEYSIKEAKEIVKYSNKKWPDIHHWYK